jgi:hypothetical protein
MAIKLQCLLLVVEIYSGSITGPMSYQMMHVDDVLSDIWEDERKCSYHYCCTESNYYIYLELMIIIIPCGVISIRLLMVSVVWRILCSTAWVFGGSFPNMHSRDGHGSVRRFSKKSRFRFGSVLDISVSVRFGFRYFGFGSVRFLAKILQFKLVYRNGKSQASSQQLS